MTDDIGLKIYNMLAQDVPELLSGDMSANAKCCAVLSDALGVLMADVIAAQGPEVYESVKTIMFAKIEATAQLVRVEAVEGALALRAACH